MPIYEFLCKDCGSFEQQRSFAEGGRPYNMPLLRRGGEAHLLDARHEERARPPSPTR